MKILVMLIILMMCSGCLFPNDRHFNRHEYDNQIDEGLYGNSLFPVEFVGKIVKLENFSTKEKIRWLGTFVSLKGKNKQYTIFENQLLFINALEITFTGKDVYIIPEGKIFKLTCLDDNNHENIGYITKWQLLQDLDGARPPRTKKILKGNEKQKGK